MQIACCLLALLIAAAQVEVSVTTIDGSVVDGVVRIDELAMTTPFGRAVVRMDAVGSIEFGDPVVVVTADHTTLRGTLDVPGITIETADGAISYPLQGLKSLTAVQRARLVAGMTTDGTARNRVTYHVRAPEDYRPGQPRLAVLILHGANMNSRMYVESIVAAWPDIAGEYVLLGVNGEHRNPDAAPGQPRYNYTYVNYAGRSKYKGYPGTDRESPALVAEAIEEIKSYVPISRLFVGGHSQGGFLTYSLMMNFPELVDGAFPISAGLIIQCEPGAYEDERLMALQRATPLAIVHGTNDGQVDFGSGLHAREAFDDAGFPMLRMFSDDRAGHRFSLLPVEKAIRWLEEMSADDAAALSDFADSSLGQGEHRDAMAAVLRAKALGDQSQRQRLAALEEKINAAAREQAEGLAQVIQTSQDSSWVEEFLAFRRQHQLAPAARPALEAYRALRERHEAEAERLFREARRDFQRGQTDAGYAKYRRIVEELYASSWYGLARRALDERP